MHKQAIRQSVKMNKFSAALLSFLVLFATCDLGQSRDINFIKIRVPDLTGFQNSAEVQTLARFAVHEYNKRENAILEFERVLKAGEQVVAGKMYHLTLEAVDAGTKKIYQAKVWVKPWINFMQLQEFKPAMDDALLSAHLLARTGHGNFDI